MEPELYQTFYEVEDVHWWFQAREKILLELIRSRTGLQGGAAVLDIGCGTGGFLKTLSHHFDVTGTDTSETAIALCRKRGLENVFACSLDEFPYAERRFDLITLLDVIEHIDDDVGILSLARGYLNPGGRILITVPAYQWLWSNHDEVNHHKRRYTVSLLRTVCDKAGLEAEWLSYFNTFLFPAAVLQRMFQKWTGREAGSEVAVPSSLFNTLLRAVFSSEIYFLRSMKFPVGLSVAAILRKSS